MNNQKFITYYRVSTTKQGLSGLGLEAQQSAVNHYLKGVIPIASFTEIESGGRNDRPKIKEAIELCLKENATLVIAKLDRLSRDVGFIHNLNTNGLKFVCCDMPEANELVIGIMAQIAQWERKIISERTKSALKALKERGKKLGGSSPEHCKRMRQAKANKPINSQVLFIVNQLKDVKNASQIALELNKQGLKTDRNCKFTHTTVNRILSKLEMA